MTTIRDAAPGDLPAILALLDQLGYGQVAEQVPARLAELKAEGRNVALVAERDDGRVVGLITLAHYQTLHAGRTAYITMLVTAEDARGGGVGRALVDAGRAWAARAGCTRLSVTSSESRAGAHAFYPRVGMPYTGRRFTAPLGEAPPEHDARR